MVLDPPREKVDVTLMIIFSFIPILGIYAAWRIQKFWMLLLIEIGISFVFGIAIIPLAFFLPELSIFIGLAVGIGANVILVKHFAEKYNDKIAPGETKSEKITNYIMPKATPVKTPNTSKNSTDFSALKRIFGKKAILVGVIVAISIFGVIHALSYNVVIMSTEGMEPIIQKNDLVYYEKTPFNQIEIGDLIVYENRGLIWVHQVIEDGVIEVIVQNSYDERNFVGSYQYMGKVTSITPDTGISSIAKPHIVMILMTIGFFIPIVILNLIRIRK